MRFFLELKNYRSKDLNSSRENLKSFYEKVKGISTPHNIKALFYYSIGLIKSPYHRYLFGKSYLKFLTDKYPIISNGWLEKEVDQLKAKYDISPSKKKKFKIRGSGKSFVDEKASKVATKNNKNIPYHGSNSKAILIAKKS